MARHDVYRRAQGQGYLLDCQADLLADFKTRVVIPLLPADDVPAATRLHPVFEISGRAYVLSTHLIVALPVERLGKAVANLESEHDAIMNALDMLLTGI